MGEKFLFVCGCPRSGTTALTQVFRWHPRIFLGIERYAALFGRSPQTLVPELFSAGRFMDIRPGDCGYRDFGESAAYSHPAGRPLNIKDMETAIRVGDKITQLYKGFEVFEGEQWTGKEIVVVQIIRSVFDVARSYEARLMDPKDNWRLSYVDGIREWSDAIELGLRALQRADASTLRTRFVVVNYERLFESGEVAFHDGCARLIEDLGFRASPQFENGLEKIFRMSEKVLERRVARGEVVSNEEVAAHLTPRALESYLRLRERAFL